MACDLNPISCAMKEQRKQIKEVVKAIKKLRANLKLIKTRPARRKMEAMIKDLEKAIMGLDGVKVAWHCKKIKDYGAELKKHGLLKEEKR